MNIGRLSFRLNRVLGHFGKVSQGMVVWLFMESLKNRYGVSLWWILAFIPLVFIVHYIDKKHIYPQESEVAFKDNPAWKRLTEDK